MRLALLQTQQRYFFLEPFGEVIHAERAHELRFVEIAFRLCDQMLQLRGQDATDVHLHAGKVAHHDGDFFLAAHRQQCALAKNI